MNLHTSFAGISIDSCFMNASGPWCTTTEDLHNLGKSKTAVIVSKSNTLVAREGNPHPRYIDTSWGSINSMGLPNQGYLFYDGMAKELEPYQKPYMVSVSGLSLEDNLTILNHLNDNPAIAAIELNLSCPNVPGKPQTAYDFEQTRKVLDLVCKQQKLPLGIKLPPYFDIVHFHQIAEIINQYPVNFVTCINSIGNGLVIDTELEQVVIKPKNGFGGIGGDYIKPTALANVRQFYTLLRNDIDIIGCGGIRTGKDAFEHILCGASAVQIGTHYMQKGVGCFEQLEKELKMLMTTKRYKTIQEFKGKLKSIV